MGLLLIIASILSWLMLECLWDGNRTVEGDVWAYKVWIAWFVAVILAPLMQNGVELAGNILSSSMGSGQGLG